MLNARRKRQRAKRAVVFEQDVSWAQTFISTDSCLPLSTFLAGTVTGSVRSEELLPNHTSFMTGGDNPPKRAFPYKC
jgi:hypothetical protein